MKTIYYNGHIFTKAEMMTNIMRFLYNIYTDEDVRSIVKMAFDSDDIDKICDCLDGVISFSNDMKKVLNDLR